MVCGVIAKGAFFVTFVKVTTLLAAIDYIQVHKIAGVNRVFGYAFRGAIGVRQIFLQAIDSQKIVTIFTRRGPVSQQI